MLYDMYIYDSEQDKGFDYFHPFDCRVYCLDKDCINPFCEWPKNQERTSNNSEIFYFQLFTPPENAINELLAKGRNIFKTISSWIGTTRTLAWQENIYSVRILGHSIWHIKECSKDNGWASCIIKIEFLDF